MNYHVMTLFPSLIESILGQSIIGRAMSGGIINLHCYDIRSYTADKHGKVDDTPFGGGMGMVMTPQPIFDCVKAVKANIGEGRRTRVIYMSPKGRIFNHDLARELIQYDELVFLCGHYEGVDQRVIDNLVDEEISIGDFVVTGGEVPACLVIDAVSRLLDGVLSSSECYEDESIASGLLEYPQYTKPREYLGYTVPDVLLSGDHAKIEKWRFMRSMEITRERRPDLLLLHPEFEERLMAENEKQRKKEERERRKKEKQKKGE